MKKLFVRLAMCAGLFSPCLSSATGLWQQVDPVQAPAKLQLMHPQHFLVYTFDEAFLKLQMWNLSTNPDDGIVISLPLPDGSYRDFKVWQTPMMPDDLASRYPDIKTFTAEAVDNRNVTAKIDFTLFGFHAMIFDGENTSFIDPYDNYHDGFYMVHYKKDEVRTLGERSKCAVQGIDGPNAEGTPVMMQAMPQHQQAAAKTINGYSLRTYRLALAANNFYCAAVGGTTIPLALSKMTTTMNRVNGVFERELSVRMTFVSNEDQIIWTTASGGPNGVDPFNLIDNNPSACLATNQTTCDTRIGSSNYDIGHVFTTNAGGLSLVDVVCTGGAKARSVTGSTSPTGDGFDIDFVAHEIGHEFGGQHPFNNGTNGSCGAGNRNGSTAYEPASGSTIMAYAGICDPDNVQAHSDAYFHAVSLKQMAAYIAAGGDCATKTSTGNKLVGYTGFTASYSIPYLTPFELTAPVLTDSVADSVKLYCWEEWDLGAASTFTAAHATGPLFRSYSPTTSRTRVFPKISMVLAGTLSNAGVNNNQGEKVPDVARSMQFRCTFRNILHNMGCINLPDDMITLTAVATPQLAGFKVTSQNTTGITYVGGETQTVTWDVVGTNASPVNAATVDIYLGTNGSNFPYFVGNFPNTGTATVTVPNPPASSPTCRFKVKGSGNVFFNVNSKNFTVNKNPAIAVAPNGLQPSAAPANTIKIFPVPAGNILHIATVNELDAVIINTVGQRIWEGKISGQTDIPVEGWARGIYYVRMSDAVNGSQSVKSVVIE